MLSDGVFGTHTGVTTRQRRGHKPIGRKLNRERCARPLWAGHTEPKEVHMLRIIVLSSAVALLAGPAIGSTYVVNPDGTGDFPTIQAAVDAAVSGDVIELGNGIFMGTGNRDVNYRGKSITIGSQGGPGACTVNCEGSASTPHRAFRFANGETHDSVLEGVTIANGYHGDGGGVLCIGSSPLIQDCVFVNNSAPYGTGGAILSGGDSYPTVIACRFYGNTAGYYGGAVCACASTAATATFTECTFAGNGAEYGGGIGI
jgi:predicted outer membrane repeat protein